MMSFGANNNAVGSRDLMKVCSGEEGCFRGWENRACMPHPSKSPEKIQCRGFPLCTHPFSQ